MANGSVGVWGGGGIRNREGGVAEASGEGGDDGHVDHEPERAGELDQHKRHREGA